VLLEATKFQPKRGFIGDAAAHRFEGPIYNCKKNRGIFGISSRTKSGCY